MDRSKDRFDLAGLPDPLPIASVDGPLDAVVRVPGSKSITNRALVCAALAAGTSTLHGALFADDTEAMLGVLEALGLTVRTDPEAETIEVVGAGGAVPATDRVIDVRQSGTTARFALPLVALGEGSYRVTADEQMQARPMDTTFDALEALGAGIEADRGTHLPATVTGGGLRSEVIRVPGDVSSQFLSGLLMIGPCLADGLVVELTTELVSRPYVDLTIAVMEGFGATVNRPDPRTFEVDPSGYRAGAYTVEPDASAASYPWAAAAMAGGSVRVEGLGPGAIQGDMAFLDVLAAMGATVEGDAGGTTVSAPSDRLTGGTFDLTHFSDTAMTLAVVAPFAASAVTVTGIGFIARKETDRIRAVATELRRVGVRCTVDEDGWTIHPGRPGSGTIETYRDHRMAMAFSLLGLVGEGIRIADPACVAKTFPGWWTVLEGMRPS